MDSSKLLDLLASNQTSVIVYPIASMKKLSLLERERGENIQLVFTITNEEYISKKEWGWYQHPRWAYAIVTIGVHYTCVMWYNIHLTPPLKLTGDHTPRVWTEENHAEPESVAWSSSLQAAARKEQNEELECLGHTDHAERMYPPPICLERECFTGFRVIWIAPVLSQWSGVGSGEDTPRSWRSQRS